ncbi:hypothetical protein MO973_03090 [Paenibacillus sp. TRM 82003]|nr:hypothetical protein [Paenibacillus sp. TRM 82003]
MKNIALGIFLLAALIAAWTWNWRIYDAQKLERPVFLAHYYEKTALALGYSRFYYIDNTDSERRPVWFELSDDLRLHIEHTQTMVRQGRLQLQEAVVAIPRERVEDWDETVHYEQLHVFYSDGTSDVAPIGELILQPSFQEPGVLETIFGRSSSDGSGSGSYRTTQETSIASVSHGFPERLSGAFAVTVPGNEPDRLPLSLPIDLSPEEGLTVEHRFLFREGDPRRYDAYDMMIRLRDPNGETLKVEHANWQPRLYDGNLADYVRLRRVN